MEYHMFFYVLAFVVILTIVIFMLMKISKNKFSLAVLGIQVSLLSILILVANINNSDQSYRILVYIMFFIGFLLSIIALLKKDK